jgi:hypothetical protein
MEFKKPGEFASFSQHSITPILQYSIRRAFGRTVEFAPTTSAF